MKNSISNVWILGLVILFILLFSGFIIITINYNKVFKMKNTVISIIEKHDGMTFNSINCGQRTSIPGVQGEVCTGAGSVQIINMYMYAMNYSTRGTCPVDSYMWYGVSDFGNSPENAQLREAGSDAMYYCVTKIDTDYGTSYFKVRLFFNFNLPIIGNLIPVNVDGSTGEIHKAKWNI